MLYKCPACCRPHFVSLESFCNTSAFELNHCVHDSLTQPLEGMHLSLHLNKEHLACLFLANIPMVSACVYRLPCPKRKFSYVGNGPQMKACSRFLVFILHTANGQREIQTRSSVMFIAEQPLISKFQPCAAIYNDT